MEEEVQRKCSWIVREESEYCSQYKQAYPRQSHILIDVEQESVHKVLN